MKQMKAAGNPIWVVLVVVATLLSSNVAYADSGDGASTYSGSHARTYDVGTCRQTAASKPGSTSAPSPGSCASARAHESLDRLQDLVDNYEPLPKHDQRTGATTGSACSAAAASSSSSATAGSSARGMHFDGDGYSVDLPAYWNDHVIVNEPDANGTTLEVRSRNYPDRVLCRIVVAPTRDRVTGGDIASPNVKQMGLTDGRMVCVHAKNYSWIATSDPASMSEAEAAELVALTTGGKTIADCERAADDGNNLVSADWIANNVKITA